MRMPPRRTWRWSSSSLKTAVKTGGVRDPLHKVAAIREAVGDDVDIMVDLHGPPWMTPKDAIVLGRALEPYHLLFLEDPVAPENIESLARVSQSVAIPIAAGERLATIWGWRAMVEREIVDVIQPDTGRAGGISQMKKLAGMAEAHHIMMAPHSRARWVRLPSCRVAFAGGHTTL
jgi:galactonate dehydratase